MIGFGNVFVWLVLGVFLPGFAGFLSVVYRARGWMLGLLAAVGVFAILLAFAPELFRGMQPPDPYGREMPLRRSEGELMLIIGPLLGLLIGGLIGRAVRDS